MIGFIISLYGLYLIATRLRSLYLPSPILDTESIDLVSIIIPARNEAHNLDRLLLSIQKQNYKNIEVIGVNDSSSDNTEEVFEKYGCKTLSLTEEQKEWSGKSFACHQGAKEANGNFLLFIDADTELKEDSISLALRHMKENKLSLMSAIPEHRIDSTWEDAMGVFHVLLYSSIRPYQPRKNWLYSNGQFLFFEKSYYLSSGGHEAVKSVLAEDLALANHCFKENKSFGVFPEPGLYKVRMYENFKEFIKGWRRNFHLGFEYSHYRSSIDVVCMMFALLGAGELDEKFFVIFSAFSIFVAYRSACRLGDHSVLALLLAPLAILSFVYVSLLALWDKIKRNKITWKGREYLAP